MLAGDLRRMIMQTSRKTPRPRTRRRQIRYPRNNTFSSLPPDLADHHLSGEMHIHDLEYFGTRPFCQDWDLRYFFYYGLMPDGNGTKASVAGPAKRAEVAILHAVKALGSAQTNFTGGQGYYNFLTFLAPYMEGMVYDEIKQNMQMFVYEMTQMMVARGGQTRLLINPVIPRSPDSLAGQTVRIQRKDLGWHIISSQDIR